MIGDGASGSLNVEAGSGSGTGATLDGVAVDVQDLVASGTIIAEGAIEVGVATTGAVLVLDDNTSITGGTLTIGASSEVEIESGGNGSATLDGVDVVNSGGLLQINSGATLGILDAVTLQGGGTVTMASGSSIAEPFTDTGSVVTLDNIDNTISGAGTIGRHDDLLAITNSGTIDANAPSGAILSIDTADDRGNSSTLTNTGTLEATNNGELSVHATVNDASGTVETFGRLRRFRTRYHRRQRDDQ